LQPRYCAARAESSAVEIDQLEVSVQIKSLMVLAVLMFGMSQVAFAKGAGAPGGQAAGSAARTANANSPTSADRDKGQARAEDRRSKEGAEHNKEGAPKKRVHKSFKKKHQ
jgi:hypothetical protein